MIYLDNASTTRPYREVADAVTRFTCTCFGNPGSLHSLGRESNRAIENAREQVAGLIGSKPNNIIFTSGGTESNNLAILGSLQYLIKSGRNKIVSSTVEHDSIFKTLNDINEDGSLGVRAVFIHPNERGIITPENVERAILGGDVGLVSIMQMNNETGVCNPVKEICEVCRSYGVLFHTDCVQSAGFLKIDVEDMGCDMLSISSHKIHGPKGAGALYVRNTDLVSPIIHGGYNQEFGKRGGTQNVASIVGFGEAARMTSEAVPRVGVNMRKLFYETLCNEAKQDGIEFVVHGDSVDNDGKILNIAVRGIDGNTLVSMMDSYGVCVSTGSACRNLYIEPSRVLTEMGVTPEEASESVRISFSADTSENDVSHAATIMALCAILLRKRCFDDNY